MEISVFLRDPPGTVQTLVHEGVVGRDNIMVKVGEPLSEAKVEAELIKEGIVDMVV